MDSLAALVLAAVLPLAACGDDDDDGDDDAPTADAGAPDADPGRPAFVGSPLGADDAHFRDGDGRTVILRGVNARIAGVFDVTFDDGRTPVEEIPEFGTEDCQRIAELGFNFLRLPINWSGVEPERDEFDEAYLLNVDAVIECAHAAGVYVLVDFHQDAWSKEIGEDGAPLWAIIPAPEMLLEGPLTDLTDRRTSPQVIKASDTFFSEGDPSGLQAEFIDALAHVATRYKDHPGVVGFEIFNEPVVSGELLYPFQYAAAARVREVAPDKLVFFEPPSFRNQLDQQPLSSEPFPTHGSVYSPHVYTAAPENFTLDDLLPSIDNARAEAIAWKTPLFIGEFGNNPDPNGMRYVGFQYDLQDMYLASSCIWLWKENVQGAWGFYDHEGSGSEIVWTERPLVVGTAARPYAQRIAGTPTKIRWDGTASTLTVELGRPVAAPNVIAVPDGYSITSATCDGTAITLPAASATTALDCGLAAGDTPHVLVVHFSR